MMFCVSTSYPGSGEHDNYALLTYHPALSSTILICICSSPPRTGDLATTKYRRKPTLCTHLPLPGPTSGHSYLVLMYAHPRTTHAYCGLSKFLSFSTPLFLLVPFMLFTLHTTYKTISTLEM